MPTDDSQWDDPDVPHDEVLYRRLHPTHWVLDEGSGERRLSSALMRMGRGEDGISVYSATLLAENDFSEIDILEDDREGIVRLTAGSARDLGYGVVKDPDDLKPVNIAHMLIKLPLHKLSDGKKRRLSLALASKSTIVRYPKV